MNRYEQIIDLETAKLAKQAGFDWKTKHYYRSDEQLIYDHDGNVENWNNEIYSTNGYVYSAPTQSVLQRWLREVKGIYVTIQLLFDKVNRQYNVVVGFTPFIHRMGGKMIIVPLDSERTYESALEAGLQKGLTLIIKKQ